MEQSLFEKVKQTIMGKQTARVLLDNALIIRQYENDHEKDLDDGHEPTAEEKAEEAKMRNAYSDNVKMLGKMDEETLSTTLRKCEKIAAKSGDEKYVDAFDEILIMVDWLNRGLIAEVLDGEFPPKRVAQRLIHMSEEYEYLDMCSRKSIDDEGKSLAEAQSGEVFAELEKAIAGLSKETRIKVLDECSKIVENPDSLSTINWIVSGLPYKSEDHEIGD